MNKLISYLRSQKKRSIASVGGGNRTIFNEQPAINQMEEAERIARWQKFQETEFGYDFLSSTIPAEITCKVLDDLSVSRQGTAAVSTILQNHDNVQPYIQSISLFHTLSDKPVGNGFFGPLTLAGGILGLKDLLLTLKINPEILQKRLMTISEVLRNLAGLFEENGADFVWIAEPTGVLVSPGHFRRFIAPCLQRIFGSVSIPGFLHMPGDTNHLLEEMMSTGAQCLSLDSMVNFRELAYRLPPDICVRGNINSVALLYKSKGEIIEQVSSLNRSIKNFPQFIVGSGGGLSLDTPESNIKAIKEETEKHDWYNEETYRKTDALWRMMVQAELHEINTCIEGYAGKSFLLLNTFEEACNYLDYRYRNDEINEYDYSRRLELLEEVIKNPKFSPADDVEINKRRIPIALLRKTPLRTFFGDG